MLQLLSARVPNVFLRCVSTATGHRQSSSYCSGAKQDQDIKNATDIAFTIPGLSPREKAFIKQQFGIILNSEDNVASGNPTEEMENEAACVHQINKVDSSFVGSENAFARKSKTPLKIQRLKAGLQLYGVQEQDFSFLFDCQQPNYVDFLEISRVLGMDSKYLIQNRARQKLNENALKSYIQNVVGALQILNFDDEADAISKIDFSSHKALRFRDVLLMTSRSVLEGIAKRNNLKKSWASNANEQFITFPVSLARNYYIRNQILRIEGLTKSIENFTRPKPLETLINLNAYHSVLTCLDPRLKDTSTFIEKVENAMLRSMIPAQTSRPYSFYSKQLRDIGFDDREIAQILQSSKFKYKSKDLSDISQSFVPVMRERLALLRLDAHNLGLFEPVSYWCAMLNWTAIMRDLATILDSKDSSGVILKPSYCHVNCTMKITSVDQLPHRSVTLPSIKFLAQYFGYTSSSDLAKLRNSTFPGVCFPTVTLNRIVEVLNKLIARGFTKQQIRKATPLLCYPPCLVEQKLDEIEANQDEDPDQLLQVCLYYIEREFNFTSDGLFAETQSATFSPQFQAELEKYRDSQVDADEYDENSAWDDVPLQRDIPVTLRSSYNYCATKGVLQANARLFSSHSAFPGTHDNVFQRRSIFTGFRGVVLQNPFRWIQVQSEFTNLRMEWDPSFNKKDFITGTKHVGKKSCKFIVVVRIQTKFKMSERKNKRDSVVQERLQILLTKMLQDEDNKYCVDCDSKGPRWASWNLGLFMCIRCAGIHRNLGVHISKVRSVNLDTWTPQQVASMQIMGNSRARAIYEASLPQDYRRPQTDSAMEQFIRSKYEKKKYIARDWCPPKTPEFPEGWNELIEAEKQKKDPKTVVLPKVSTPVLKLKSPNPVPALKSLPAQPIKPVTPQPQQKESTEAKPSGNFLADDLFGLSLGNDVTISGFTDFTSSAPATNNKPNIEPSKSNYASDLLGLGNTGSVTNNGSDFDFFGLNPTIDNSQIPTTINNSPIPTTINNNYQTKTESSNSDIFGEFTSNINSSSGLAGLNDINGLVGLNGSNNGLVDPAENQDSSKMSKDSIMALFNKPSQQPQLFQQQHPQLPPQLQQLPQQQTFQMPQQQQFPNFMTELNQNVSSFNNLGLPVPTAGLTSASSFSGVNNPFGGLTSNSSVPNFDKSRNSAFGAFSSQNLLQ